MLISAERLVLLLSNHLQLLLSPLYSNTATTLLLTLQLTHIHTYLTHVID